MCATAWVCLQQNEYDDLLGTNQEEEEEDEGERRRREKEAQIESDLDNAASLLGASQIDEKQSGGSMFSSLTSAKTTNKDEWEAYAKEVYNKLIQPRSSLPGFDKHFLPCLLTLLTTQGLRDVDMRKGSTKLRELAEAKVKADKEAKKTGGNVKRTVPAKPKQVGTSSAKNTYVSKSVYLTCTALTSRRTATRRSTTILTLCRW